MHPSAACTLTLLFGTDKSGKELRRIDVPSEVTTLDTDEANVIIGSHDNVIRVFRRATGQLVQVL
jgi:hypothetical protein